MSVAMHARSGCVASGGWGGLYGDVSRRLQLDRGEMAPAPPCGRFRLLHERLSHPSPTPRGPLAAAWLVSRTGTGGQLSWVIIAMRP